MSEFEEHLATIERLSWKAAFQEGFDFDSPEAIPPAIANHPEHPDYAKRVEDYRQIPSSCRFIVWAKWQQTNRGVVLRDGDVEHRFTQAEFDEFYRRMMVAAGVSSGPLGPLPVTF
jgi:hypothetical protein